MYTFQLAGRQAIGPEISAGQRPYQEGLSGAFRKCTATASGPSLLVTLIWAGRPILLDDPADARVGAHGFSRLFPEGDEFLSEVHQGAELLVYLGKLAVEQRQDM